MGGSRPTDARLPAGGLRSVVGRRNIGRSLRDESQVPSAVVPRELCSGGNQRFVDQAVGVIKGGRLHSRTVRRRKGDELDVSRIPSDVGLKPTLGQQAEPVQGGGERALRRPLGEAARVPSRENKDPLGTELDRRGLSASRDRRPVLDRRWRGQQHSHRESTPLASRPGGGRSRWRSTPCRAYAVASGMTGRYASWRARPISTRWPTRRISAASRAPSRGARCQAGSARRGRQTGVSA